MAKELNFTLEGVQGDLKLKYGPFNQRLYQDGREIPLLSLQVLR